jgi:hypothetical protein
MAPQTYYIHRRRGNLMFTPAGVAGHAETVSERSSGSKRVDIVGSSLSRRKPRGMMERDWQSLCSCPIRM